MSAAAAAGGGDAEGETLPAAPVAGPPPAAAPGAASAAGSAAGSVMFTTDAPQLIEHVSKALSFTPSDVKWVPVSSRFVAVGQHARGTGAINVNELTSTETRVVKEIERPSGIKCATFGASLLEDRHLAVGDYAGALTVLDLERPADAVWCAGKAHASVVNCMDGCGGLNIGGGAPEIVTGGRDGCVRLWDTRVPDAVLSLEPAPGEAARDCWTVAFGNSFSDEERCIAAGYDNGDLKIFDLRTQSMRWETNLGNGVVSAEFDRKDIEANKLVAATLESKFRVFDCRTQHPEEGFASLTERAHKATVWLARHLPQNRDIWMTSGGNGGINLYRYHYPASRLMRDAEGRARGRMGRVELLNARIVSSQPVVGWDWSSDKEGLAAAVCLDQTLRVFIVTRLGKL